MPPKTDGIVESSLYVSDVHRSARFYEETFGFRVIVEFGERGCAMHAGTRQVLSLFKKGASLAIQSPHDGDVPQARHLIELKTVRRIALRLDPLLPKADALLSELSAHAKYLGILKHVQSLPPRHQHRLSVRSVQQWLESEGNSYIERFHRSLKEEEVWTRSIAICRKRERPSLAGSKSTITTGPIAESKIVLRTRPS